MIYPLFGLFLSSCHIRQHLPSLSLALSLSIYIYIYVCVCVSVCVCVCVMSQEENSTDTYGDLNSFRRILF